MVTALEAGATVMAGLLLAQGLLGVAEQRLYTDAQRAGSPLVVRLNLFGSLLAVGIGVLAAAWIRRRGLPSPWHFLLLNVWLLLTVFLRIATYRATGVSHSPVIDRVAARLF
ncbi:hypothetical protein C478_09479 [Natrinema thermotolerans DSM 11552]|nr:hypothetical protein C478_09479 [Natrinema thermotolerans DSM 11552]